MSIKYRLLLYFLFFIILPTSAITITVYNRSVESINTNIVRTAETNIKAASTNFLQRVEVAQEIATYLYLSPEFQQIISSKRPEGSAALVREINAMDRILDNYEYNYGSQVSFVPKVYLYDRPEYYQLNSSSRVGSITDIETQEWYMDLPHQQLYSVVGVMDEKNRSAVTSIRLVKRLFALGKLHIGYAGILTLDVDINEFKNRLNELKLTPGTRYMVMDEHSNVLFSANGESASENQTDNSSITASIRSGQGMYQTVMDGEEVLVSYSDIGNLPWKMVMVSPVNELDNELTLFKNSMTLALVTSMIIAFLLAWLVSTNIARPIKKFISYMSYAKEGNFNAIVKYRRKDEFATLFERYNLLLHEINELINKLYVSEIHKKEAELRVLQAQINPHFLYNTLDFLNWMALKHGAKDMSQMITYLSDFFRLSLHDGDNIVPLGDEMKQISIYLAIQQRRFEEKMDFSIEMEEHLQQYLIPKLIVQPLVENSIVHGISPLKGERGFIEVQTYLKDEHIVIQISDNGVGADLAIIQEILESSPNSKRSFGLRNVHLRMKYYFGDQYGVEVTENDETGGITIVLRFPAVSDRSYFNKNRA